ncbi:MAG: condensation domain-containing protein, partial [Mycobacteriales bacterium]
MTTTQPGPPARSGPELSAARRALLEQRLRRRPASDGIPPRPAGTAPPLSYGQERLWFMEQFAPGTAAYSVPVVLHLGADVDLPALRRALAALAERHESLRMRFPATEDGQPTVVVDPPGEVPLDVAEAADEQAAAVAVAAVAARPFDLAAGPLLHGLLVRDAGSGRHRLLLSAHHAVTDGWSTEVLLDDLLVLYAAERAGRPAGLAPLPVRYGDFAAWQRARAGSPAVARDLDYWRRQLAGVPALELPTDAPRPPAQTFTGAAYPFRLPADLVAGLEALGRA